MIYTLSVDFEDGAGMVEYDSCEATMTLSTGGATSNYTKSLDR